MNAADKERSKKAPGRSPGRPGLAPQAASRVRELVEEMLSREPYIGRGGVTRLAEAIGISQPALTQIRQGGGVSPDTAVAVARLAGVDPRDLLGGAYVGVAIDTKFPRLEACLIYHLDDEPERWSPATIAAAREGWWPDDVGTRDWVVRLDELERIRKAFVARAPAPPVSNRRPT